MSGEEEQQLLRIFLAGTAACYPQDELRWMPFVSPADLSATFSFSVSKDFWMEVEGSGRVCGRLFKVYGDDICSQVPMMGHRSVGRLVDRNDRSKCRGAMRGYGSQTPLQGFDSERLLRRSTVQYCRC